MSRSSALRSLAVVGLAAAVAAGSQALVVSPAGAQSKPGAAKELPALVSEAAPRPAPYVAAGDFTSSPPRPEEAEARAAAPKATSFDPARSTVDQAETTPTRRVWKNPDGSRTAEVSTQPLRYKAASGQWREFDLSVTANSDGTLAAKDAPGGARLGARADADVATIATSAGPILLRHPDAAPVAGAATKEGATYAKALPGGRDLVLAPTADGVKETVVLHDPGASASYREQFVLPAGVTARSAEGGIDFLNAAGAVVASVASGWAFDAGPVPGPGGITPVVLRLVGDGDSAKPSAPAAGPATTVPATTTSPTTATAPAPSTTTTTPVKAAANVTTVEVSIDPAFLATPGRAFPVRIDPTLATRWADAAGAFDIAVYSGAYANTSYAGHGYLGAGNAGGAYLVRSMLRFDLSGLPTGAGVNVLESHLSVYEWYSYGGAACVAKSVKLRGLTSTPNAATTWNTKPGFEAGDPVSTSLPFVHHDGAPNCPGGPQNLDATTLARRWLHDSATNDGLGLEGAEGDTGSYQAYYAAEVGGAAVPTLSVTYNRPPAMTTPTSAGTPPTPPDGSPIMTTTPTLRANTVTDPDGDTVYYWFRGTANTLDDGDGNGDAETGRYAIESGWLASPSYTVPPGTLEDGLTYSWHVWTWDGIDYIAPTWEWSFTVDLHRGAEPAAPYDALGPAQVTWSRAMSWWAPGRRRG